MFKSKTPLLMVLILVGSLAALGAAQLRSVPLKQTTLIRLPGVTSQAQGVSPDNQEPAQPGTLKWHAQQARERGQRQVTIPAPIPMIPRITSLEQALAYYTVVIAQPVKMKVAIPNSRNVFTWYKFKVIETLSQKNSSDCPQCPSQQEVPQDLLPLNADEILIPRTQGTVLIDGVQLTMVDRASPFSQSQKYLLFVALNSTKVGTLILGANGVFVINPNDSLAPLTVNPHPLRQDIETRYGNSVNLIKARFDRAGNRD